MVYDELMTTNYYARMKDRNSPLELNLHIGIASGEGLSVISGLYFPSVQAWSDFLRHNANSITIVDEYAVEYEVEEFIKDMLEATPSASFRQREWLKDNGYEILESAPSPVKYTGAGEYWLDGARLFHNAVFF